MAVMMKMKMENSSWDCRRRNGEKWEGKAETPGMKINNLLKRQIDGSVGEDCFVYLHQEN